jgi:hypothetical protein
MDFGAQKLVIGFGSFELGLHFILIGPVPYSDHFDIPCSQSDENYDPGGMKEGVKIVPGKLGLPQYRRYHKLVDTKYQHSIYHNGKQECKDKEDEFFLHQYQSVESVKKEVGKSDICRQVYQALNQSVHPDFRINIEDIEREKDKYPEVKMQGEPAEKYFPQSVLFL